MKRLRPRIFEGLLFKEADKIESTIDLFAVERLRRLIWCYNKYYENTLGHNLYLRHVLSICCLKVRHSFPGIWLPKIK